MTMKPLNSEAQRIPHFKLWTSYRCSRVSSGQQRSPRWSLWSTKSDSGGGNSRTNRVSLRQSDFFPPSFLATGYETKLQPASLKCPNLYYRHKIHGCSNIDIDIHGFESKSYGRYRFPSLPPSARLKIVVWLLPLCRRTTNDTIDTLGNRYTWKSIRKE